MARNGIGAGGARRGISNLRRLHVALVAWDIRRMHGNESPQPGDYILDRYMPNANEAEREAARENLYALAAVILRICTRIAQERHEAIRKQAADDIKCGHEP